MARRKFKSEQEVNDFYDEKKLKTEVQYESRIRDIDSQINTIEDKSSAYNKYYASNEELAEQRNKLLSDFESQTVDTTRLEIQVEIKRNRYNALESQWSVTEDASDRENIKQEAIRVGNEIQEVESRIESAKQQDELTRQRYYEQDRILVKKIERNNERIESQNKLKDKQDELFKKKAILSEKTEEDLSEIERKRGDALEKLPKGIPSKTIDIEFFTYGMVSSGSDRYITVKVVATITVPANYTEDDIKKESKFLLKLCDDAWQYIEGTENISATVDISYEFFRPSSKGIYHYDERLKLTYTASDEIFVPEDYTFKNDEYIAD